jgi:hypothetical protein
MDWVWDDEDKTYHQGVAGSINAVLDATKLINLRDLFTDRAMRQSDKLVESLMLDGSLSIQQWELQMRALLRDTYRAMYELAVGGRGNMTQEDYGRLGGILQEQYRYLHNFAADLAAGRLSPLQAQNRARMYIESATQAFERAQAAVRGIVLPQYPGDGGTQCLSNCRCHWEIRERKKEYACYWRLGEAEHCPDCLMAAQLYKPYIVLKG